MSSWKLSYERTNRELELAEKKKQALDDLLAKGRMSQPTYDHLIKNLAENICQLENHLRSLGDKITNRADELKRQLTFIELFLASLEIRHISGEMDEGTYANHKGVFMRGFDATKAEMGQLEEALAKVVSP